MDLAEIADSLAQGLLRSLTPSEWLLPRYLTPSAQGLPEIKEGEKVMQRNEGRWDFTLQESEDGCVTLCTLLSLLHCAFACLYAVIMQYGVACAYLCAYA
jgi:hypothetical protein